MTRLGLQFCFPFVVGGDFAQPDIIDTLDELKGFKGFFIPTHTHIKT